MVLCASYSVTRCVFICCLFERFVLFCVSYYLVTPMMIINVRSVRLFCLMFIFLTSLVNVMYTDTPYCIVIITKLLKFETVLFVYVSNGNTIALMRTLVSIKFVLVPNGGLTKKLARQIFKWFN